MKTISLWQPWAELIRIGVKTIETRSWYTSHRGLIAIHATKKTPDDVIALFARTPFESDNDIGLMKRRLREHGVTGESIHQHDGCIIATARLVACHRTPWGSLSMGQKPFGDFSPGRYAWVLEDIMPLDPVVPARGRQMLWEWATEQAADARCEAEQSQIRMVLP